jgi:hypothetical protein
MSNKSGNAYGLTALIPIKNNTVAIDEDSQQSYASKVLELLQEWQVNEKSPMAVVPNTYICRFYVLNDVFYEGSPAHEDHLKSKYIVFSSNFHGDSDKFQEALTTYLQGMWEKAQTELKEVFQYCVAFDTVKTTQDFVNYIKRCQINNALFFNGSTDDSLAEQLKALYLKQALSHFVYNNQPLIQSGQKNAADLQKAFQAFVQYTKPDNLNEQTWTPGSENEPQGLAQDIAKL